MTDLHQQADDATVVPPDKRADLIPSHITLRSELNALELENILDRYIETLKAADNQDLAPLLAFARS